MFDDEFFIKWLDQEANKSMIKLNKQQQLSSNEMMVLMLKAQTNHIDHLETDLRGEMVTLRKDMSKRFEHVEKRFEQVEKRFEQVDKRLEQMENRFEHLTLRIDNFMKWSLAVTIGVGGLVVTLTKILVG